MLSRTPTGEIPHETIRPRPSGDRTAFPLRGEPWDRMPIPRAPPSRSPGPPGLVHAPAIPGPVKDGDGAVPAAPRPGEGGPFRARFGVAPGRFRRAPG